MRAGVLQFFSWPERRAAIETVYERALQRIEIMESSGYDAVWLAEHTSGAILPPVICSSCLMEPNQPATVPPTDLFI